jgi:hypothetical protein
MTLLPTIEPHALRLEAIANEMEAAGIGGDPTNGHAVVLRKMAGDTRAQAARGHMPAALNAAAATQSYGVSGVLRACKDAGVDVPVGKRFSSLAALNMELDRAFKGNTSNLALGKRMELKAKILASGLVAGEVPAVDEVRVKNVVRLLNKYGIKFTTTLSFRWPRLTKR